MTILSSLGPVQGVHGAHGIHGATAGAGTATILPSTLISNRDGIVGHCDLLPGTRAIFSEAEQDLRLIRSATRHIFCNEANRQHRHLLDNKKQELDDLSPE